MRSALLLAALAALAPGCTSGDDSEVAEITVLDHLIPCRTFQLLDCMVIEDDSGTQTFDVTIEGFTYDWGSTYRLEVDIVKIRNPVPDAPSRELHLRKIIEVQPTAPRSEFTLDLQGDVNPPSRLLQPAGQGFAMPFGRPIVCQDAAVCTTLTNALSQPGAFTLTLRHPDDPSDELVPLTAVAVVRSPIPPS